MANYKHMEMAEALSNDSRINISRGFLGLKTNLTYAPTSSKINLKVNEYAPDMEGRLTQLLQTDGKAMRSEVEKGKLPTVAVGPFRLEIACSQDYEYLAVQLFRFSNFNYSPMTEMKVYEGDDALAVSALLC